ncbi:MAG: von Willebrand factor type A domain-containing protein, partial [Planctomycetales bacterium]|nr:von Willebrand factor type A domain-containing protein [Planctomycetales bacterium]
MNDENRSSIDVQLEARLVALALGEVSDFERDELLQLVADRPEVAAFLQEIQEVHGLLAEVGAADDSQSVDASWRLPDKLRSKLLETLETTPEPPSVNHHLAAEQSHATKPRAFANRRLLWGFTSAAALLVAAVFLAGNTLLSNRVSNRIATGYRVQHSLNGDSDMAVTEAAQGGNDASTDYWGRAVEAVPVEAKEAAQRQSQTALDAIRQSVTGVPLTDHTQEAVVGQERFNLSAKPERLYSLEEQAERIIAGKQSTFTRGRAGGVVTKGLTTTVDQGLQGVDRQDADRQQVDSAFGRFASGGARSEKEADFGDSASPTTAPTPAVEDLARSANSRGFFSAQPTAESKDAAGAMNGPATEGEQLGEYFVDRDQSSDHRLGFPVERNPIFKGTIQRPGSQVEADANSVLPPVEAFGMGGMGIQNWDELTQRRKKYAEVDFESSKPDQSQVVELEGREYTWEARPSRPAPATAADASPPIDAKSLDKSGTVTTPSLGVPAQRRAQVELALPTLGEELAPVPAREDSPPAARLSESTQAGQWMFRASDLGSKFSTLSDEIAESTQPQGSNSGSESLFDVPLDDSERQTVTFDKRIAGRELYGLPVQVESRQQIESRQVPVPADVQELDAGTEPFSTFSLHVSDVAFELARTALAQNEWPKPETVRIEEFVNAFDYGDPLPSGDEKVSCTTEQSIHPALQQRNMLRVAIRTAAAGRAANTPLNLCLLLDNSGSMERPDRQQTVRRA